MMATLLVDLFQSTASVPGWAWLALLVMIAWGLLLPGGAGDGD